MPRNKIPEGTTDVIDVKTGEVVSQLDLVEYLNSKGKRLDALGREIPDPTPLAPPLGYRKQASIFDQVRAMVLSDKLAAEAEAAGFETLEEADDFDVGDDFDPRSPFEFPDDNLTVAELKKIRGKAEDAIKEYQGREDARGVAAMRMRGPTVPPPPPEEPPPSEPSDGPAED